MPAALKTALLIAEVTAVVGAEGAGGVEEVKFTPDREIGKLEVTEEGGGLRLKAAASEAG